ncbi:hypothetical protein AP75_02385 [Kaistella haifensis DSM 19056]|uniref:Lipoprotein n=1 Tax=Kaistella haifensis DSM 19056 TaxID=1450526 RepID=A0A246BCD6_9FLAO|nr:hypothetical protein [Kaistella haifensis]OWK99347.1 hypothetical protein AP75_02385 [Kaistella haifensis DSM 19056]
MRKVLIIASICILASCTKEEKEKIVNHKKFNPGRSVIISSGTVGIANKELAEKHFKLIMSEKEEEAAELRSKINLKLIKNGTHAIVIEEGENLSRIATENDTIWVVKELIK